ncbi:MAG TPA: penicillin-binding transpeptidase domain-containing protein [Actinomycetota bacterium]|jgi:peptidoglycan glycosyltransferase
MDRRVRRLGVAFVVLFAVLFAQVAYVQVVAADRIANQPANAARQIRAEYQTERGQILAANEVILAESVEAPEGSLYRFERSYPLGDLYSHITGYYSRVFGRAGLEQSMNPYLSGTAPELAASNLTDLILGRSKEGGTVVTTIEPSVQEAAREALGAQRGAVVALDPVSGDILAFYSNPGYDPTELSVGTADEMTAAWERLNADPEKPLLSKASQELYLPGSTFKLITASAALENGISPDSQWPNPRVLDLPTTEDDLENFGGSLCNGGSAKVTMAEAFKESCNVTFGEIGLDLGADPLSAQAFGYGLCETSPPDDPGCSDQTIPFVLPFETGRFPTPAYFDQRVPALAYSAVGLDNDLMNPLHLALVSATIANGGSMPVPRLVTEVRDPQGRVVRGFGPQIWGRPISVETAAEMEQLMISVVAAGTGTAAQIPGVTVAGKTGTATNGEGRPPNAWFTAYAPAGQGQRNPQVAVAVIVLDGGSLQNEATGGRVAAPIAKAVMEAALALS